MSFFRGEVFLKLIILVVVKDCFVEGSGGMYENLTALEESGIDKRQKTKLSPRKWG